MTPECVISQTECGPQTPCTGTVVLVHGLNIAPSAMEPLAAEFVARGKRVLIVALTGHRPGIEEGSLVSATRWKQDLREALDFAESFPEPVWALGYSLGGLVSVAVLQERARLRVDRLLLLAPAIGFRSWVGCGGLLSRIVPTWFPLRSGVPKRYRARAGIRSPWYRALFDLHREVQQDCSEGALRHLNLKIFISKSDEFMKWSSLESWTSQRDFKNVQMHAIQSVATDFLAPNHLVLDDHCLGKAAWGCMLDKMNAAG